MQYFVESEWGDQQIQIKDVRVKLVIMIINPLLLIVFLIVRSHVPNANKDLINFAQYALMVL